MRLPALSPAARARWPLALLLISITLTGVAAIEAQRAVQSRRQLTERALSEMASLAAWTYQQHLRDTLALVAREALGTVNHGDGRHTNPRIPDAGELLHYLYYDKGCACHRARFGPVPGYFLGFDIKSDTLAIATNGSDDPDAGWRTTPRDPHALPETERMSLGQQNPPAPHVSPAPFQWIGDTLRRHIRAGLTHNTGYALVIGRREPETRGIFYTLMHTSWGDTIVYGAVYSADNISRLMASVLDGAGLLPLSFTDGARNRDVLAVSVRDGAGQRLFEPDPGQEWRLDAEHRLPSAFGGLVVQAQLHPSLVTPEALAPPPTSRPLFLFGLLALAAALSVVAMAQIRREGELARLRGDFVSGVSHELRTPLAQMRLYLETLRLGRVATDEQRRWTLDNVERETTRLTQLVERVLRFSRVGRDDAVTRAPIGIGDEVRQIVEEFEPLATSRRARLELDLPELPRVALEPDALRQILINLLDNAVKFGPVNQLITIRGRPANGMVRLEIEDQGPGVSARDRERVWNEFERGSMAGQVAGSGLGLPIVRDLVSRHGGRAWIEDGAERGARLVVEFPALPEETVPEAAQNEAYAPNAF